MAISPVPFQPYTGMIDPGSKRYQAAKAILDQGKTTKSEEQEKYKAKLEELRTLLRMLGKDTSVVDEMAKLYEGDEELAIRNIMGRLDEDGDLVNCYGVAGMDITGKDPSTFHKIIDVPEAARQDMFDMALREYVRDCGMGSGDTDRTAVFTRYQLSVKKSDRLMGTWTLEQYERCYNRAFYSMVKEANPQWQPGQKFDSSILKGITREEVERRIVQTVGESLMLTRGNEIDVKA